MAELLESGQIHVPEEARLEKIGIEDADAADEAARSGEWEEPSDCLLAELQKAQCKTSTNQHRSLTDHARFYSIGDPNESELCCRTSVLVSSSAICDWSSANAGQGSDAVTRDGSPAAETTAGNQSLSTVREDSHTTPTTVGPDGQPTPHSGIPAGGAASASAAQNVRSDEKNDQSIFDPEKRRYIDSSSAIAFPRLLGIQLGAERAPKLHSFAWHLGIRSEPLPPTLDITTFLSLDDVYRYADRYFALVHPSFDILDQQVFTRRASLRWTGTTTEEALAYDPIICGVVSLGHFFSEKIDSGLEAALTSLAKGRLDQALPTSDVVAAWILRTIYLRATSRPNASWMASNIVMHLAEACGIHRGLSSIALIYPTPKAGDIDERKLYARKVFWVGRAINGILSYEYSRPRINTEKISVDVVDSEVNDSTRDLLRIVELIPRNSQACDYEVDVEQSRMIISSVRNMTELKTPVSLLAVDIAFAAYRHLRPFLGPSAPGKDSTISSLLEIGSSALETIHNHLSSTVAAPDTAQGQQIPPWWSVVTIPFHYILLLLSLDTQESLSRVPRALQVLREVAAAFDSYLTREAVQNATMLIRLSQSQKEGNVRVLKQALNEADSTLGSLKIRAQDPPGRPTAPNTASENRGEGDQRLQRLQQSLNSSIANGSIDPELGSDGRAAGGDGADGDGDIGADQMLAECAALDWNTLFKDLDWI